MIVVWLFLVVPWVCQRVVIVVFPDYTHTIFGNELTLCVNSNSYWIVNQLETIYISFIRPIFEYGDVVWDNCTQQEKHDIEKIQIEAARMVTGSTKLV